MCMWPIKFDLNFCKQWTKQTNPLSREYIVQVKSRKSQERNYTTYFTSSNFSVDMKHFSPKHCNQNVFQKLYLNEVLQNPQRRQRNSCQLANLGCFYTGRPIQILFLLICLLTNHIRSFQISSFSEQIWFVKRLISEKQDQNCAACVNAALLPWVVDISAECIFIAWTASCHHCLIDWSCSSACHCGVITLALFVWISKVFP
jgi:hypothetical protein